MGDRKKDLSADNVFVRKYIRILHSTPRCILMAFEEDNSAERYRKETKILADIELTLREGCEYNRLPFLKLRYLGYFWRKL